MTDDYKKILLKANDGQDLTIVAGLIQDSILQLSEVKYDDKKQNLVLILNRFCWEVNAENKQGQTAWDIINQNQYLKETKAYPEFKKIMDANQKQ